MKKTNPMPGGGKDLAASNMQRFLTMLAISFVLGCFLTYNVMKLFEPKENPSFIETYAVKDDNALPGQPITPHKGEVPVSSMPVMDIEDHKNGAVSCYNKKQFDELIAGRQVSMTASGQFGGDDLHIYIGVPDMFYAFVIGNDAAGQFEACEVAYGTKWQINTP